MAVPPSILHGTRTSVRIDQRDVCSRTWRELLGLPVLARYAEATPGPGTQRSVSRETWQPPDCGGFTRTTQSVGRDILRLTGLHDGSAAATASDRPADTKRRSRISHPHVTSTFTLSKCRKGSGAAACRSHCDGVSTVSPEYREWCHTSKGRDRVPRLRRLREKTDRRRQWSTRGGRRARYADARLEVSEPH